MAFFFFLLGLLAALGALAVAFLRLPAKLEAKLRAMTAAKKPGVWNKRHPALRDLKLLPNTAAPDMAELKLKVKIIEATGLAPAEKNGSSDAYVRLSFGGQSRKTKFIPKSLHPHWNERCVFPVSDLNENLLLNVFDHEAVGSDRSLGTKQIPISDLTVGKEHDFWTGLEGIASTDSGKVEATGQVHLALELLSPSSPEWASFDSLQGGMVGKEERVKVTIVEAADLTPMRANGPADPCVKLTIGDSKIETPAVPKTLTPVWNVVTFFSVPDVESEKMTINVLDKVTGKSMGSATVRLTHFFPKLNESTHNVERSCWLELEGYAQTESRKVAATGHIHVTLELLDTEIITPMRLKEVAARGSTQSGPALGGIANSLGNSIIMRHISGAGSVEKQKEKKEKEKAVRRQFDAAELKYRLKVQIVEARNLVAADSNGKSSPFVKIKCGVGKARTHHQSKTLNPEWNAAFYVGVADLEKDKLYLTVMSHEKLSEHRPLGAAIVSLDRLATERSRDLWVPLEGYATTTSGKMTRLASGDVHVVIERLEPSPVQTVEPPPRSAAGHADEARAASTAGKAASEQRERLPGHLKITAVEATDLMPVTEKDLPDVLLKLYIKGKKYEAPTQKRTTNPQWSNFVVQVDVDDVRSEKLIVKLVEERSFIHRDRVLGNASISLAELPNGVQREMWIPLEGVTTVEENKKKREVKVRGDIHLFVTFTEKGGSGGLGSELLKPSASVPPSRPPTPPPAAEPVTLTPPVSPKKEEKDDPKLPVDEDSTPECMRRIVVSLSEIRGADLEPVSIVATRILRDLTSSEEFQAKILYKIRGALGKIFRPSWLGPLNLEEFDLGTKKHLTLEGKVARVLTTTIEGELIAEAEAVADAGINLRLATSLVLPIPVIGPIAIPISASLSVHKLHGKINLYFPPQSNEQFSISFLELPEVAEYTASLMIGRSRFNLCSFPHIRSLVDAGIMFGLRKAMVYPNVLALFLPIPGIDVDPDIISGQDINAPPEPLPTETKQRKGKEKPFPNDKPEVRELKVLYGRFLDEVLNKNNFSILPELFMDNATLHGFSTEESDVTGLAQVRTSLENLKKSYPDLHFYIEDLVCDTYNPSVRSVMCRWRGVIANSPLLYGLHCVRVDLNEHKIIDVWQYWHPGSALGLGDKWTQILSAFATATPLPATPSEPASASPEPRRFTSVHEPSRRTTRKVSKGQRCLRIDAIEGRNLIPADSNGLSDPYLKIKFPGESKSVKTGVAKETLNPLWNQTLILPIPNVTPPPVELRVEAWDEDAIKDDPLGFCLIALTDLQMGIEKRGWYTLQGVASGEICIGITAIVAGDEEVSHS